ncbi:MAG: glycosyltransferase family 2 protein [Planctomycetes bacterium]|nr:glycosyltransferase family 2 protein [Planctomycetota bacterium]
MDSAVEGPAVSIVLPLLNEQESLRPLFEGLTSALRDRAESFEFIFVDDGSTDGSLAVLRELRARDARVRYLALSRNFGHQAALLAGMRAAGGRAVISLDADLQHPPALLPALLEAWHAGAEVVQTRREGSGEETWSKRLLSRGFYWVFRRLCGLDLPAGVADFRLLDRRVVDGLLQFSEPPFWRAMVMWSGFRRVFVAFDAPPRRFGQPKYTLEKSLAMAVEGLFAYSRVPILFLWLLAAAASGLGFVAALHAAISFCLGLTLPGWTTLAVLTGFLSGAILCALATIATYVERTHRLALGRPPFLVSAASDDAAFRAACGQPPGAPLPPGSGAR